MLAYHWPIKLAAWLSSGLCNHHRNITFSITADTFRDIGIASPIILRIGYRYRYISISILSLTKFVYIILLSFSIVPCFLWKKSRDFLNRQSILNILSLKKARTLSTLMFFVNLLHRAVTWNDWIVNEEIQQFTSNVYYICGEKSLSLSVRYFFNGLSMSVSPKQISSVIGIYIFDNFSSYRSWSWLSYSGMWPTKRLSNTNKIAKELTTTFVHCISTCK